MNRLSNIANKTATIAVSDTRIDPDRINGQEYQIEGYWDSVTGESWMDAEGNPAALKYAMRAGLSGLPVDDLVLYGKVNGLGHLVHQSELTIDPKLDTL